MTKSKQHKKVGGAVLVMVLIVMVVLIMMLMATLTVVTTASKRIYTKYEENQAYYTARSALDVFWQNIITDAHYYAYDASGIVREYQYTDPKDGSIKSAKMLQGLALEAELYKLKSQGRTTKAIAKKLHPTWDDDTAAEALDFLENFESTDQVWPSGSPENDFYSIRTSPDTVDSITFEVRLPEISSASNKFGSFVDTDPNDPTKQVAEIKLEVVDRMFDVAGSYGTNTTERREKIIDIIDEGDPAKIAQLKEDIKNGDRTKDILVVKVTSTTEVKGTQGEASLVMDVKKKSNPDGEGAITSTGAINQGSGIFPVGGASQLEAKHNFKINQGATSAGDIFTNSSITTDGETDVIMFRETVHYAGNDVKFTNSYFKPAQGGSVLYSEGAVFLDMNKDYSEATKEANLVARQVNFVNNGKQMNFYGNIYCDNLYLTSADLGQRPNVTGGIYANYVDMTEHVDNITDVTKTDIAFKTNTLTKNITGLAPKITVAKGFIINVNGKPERFTWNGGYGLVRESTGMAYNIDTSGEPIPPFVYNSGYEVKIEYHDPTHYKYEDGVKTFTLPVKLAGGTSNKFEVPTAKKLYSVMFKEEAFVEDDVDTGYNGELKDYPTMDTSALSVMYPSTGGSYLSADIIKGISEGTINNSNYSQYGFTWKEWYGDTSVWPNVESVRDVVNTAVFEAENPDDPSSAYTYYPAYKTAYNEYYKNNVIYAYEKAGEEDCPSLLKYTSAQDPITVKPVADALNPDDFSFGGEYSALSGASGVINESGYIMPGTMYGSEYSPVIIDARENDIIIQLGAENGYGANCVKDSVPTFKGNFVVVGKNEVKIYLPDGRDYNLGETNATNKFQVRSYYFYDSATCDDASIGPNGETKGPNVGIFVGNEVENVYVNAPGDAKLLTAYIYAPLSHWDMTAGADKGKTMNVDYISEDNISVNVTTTGSDFGYSVIGSVISKEYSSGNKTGVLYLPPDSGGSGGPSEPKFQWDAEVYTRN